jgi:hypothetical protein
MNVRLNGLGKIGVNRNKRFIMEYSMMAATGEGFEIFEKKGEFSFNYEQVATV